MKRVISNDRFVVYDDVLPQDQFFELWNYVQNEKFVIPHMSGWQKVWRLNDGHPYGSMSYKHSDAPFNIPLDIFHELCLKMAETNSEFLEDWDEITMRTYLYPRDTKLSWHNDTGYAGAIVYYAHPYWGSTWGGELFIAQTPEISSPPMPHLDHRLEDQFMSTIGCGYYITCKPNRLVLQKPNVWHQINRVDADAGDHVRASLVGFFQKGS